MVKKHVINESEENRYSREINVSMGTNHEQRFKGMEIDDVNPSLNSKIRVSYDIEQEFKSWGISDISINGIQGPSEINVSVQYYPDDSNDYKTEEIVVPLDWENSLEIREHKGKGVVAIGDELEISLYFAEDGTVSTEMFLDVYIL
jgi:hypothetical protein